MEFKQGRSINGQNRKETNKNYGLMQVQASHHT